MKLYDHISAIAYWILVAIVIASLGGIASIGIIWSNVSKQADPPIDRIIKVLESQADLSIKQSNLAASQVDATTTLGIRVMALEARVKQLEDTMGPYNVEDLNITTNKGGSSVR